MPAKKTSVPYNQPQYKSFRDDSTQIDAKKVPSNDVIVNMFDENENKIQLSATQNQCKFKIFFWIAMTIYLSWYFGFLPIVLQNALWVFWRAVQFLYNMLITLVQHLY